MKNSEIYDYSKNLLLWKIVNFVLIKKVVILWKNSEYFFHLKHEIKLI